MLKKVCLCFMALILFGCSQIIPGLSQKKPVQGYSYHAYKSADEYTNDLKKDSFKVAMLLPLSGKASTYGKGLQNAAMMAIEDTSNTHLEIRFYDTRSTGTGALEAFHQAVANHAKLILGPLTADEVSAVSPSAKRENIPVISFSTSPQVLGGGVYTIGLLSDEQIERIVSYAASQGRQNIAVVVPDSASGLNIAKSAFDAAAQHGARVSKIGFYEPSSLEFSDLVQKMVASKNFDTILIAETGSRLKAIASTFGYYDVSYPDVLFIGTSVWENTNLTKETTLYHAIYPSISRVHADYFNNKYKDLFLEQPNSLYTYAYDAVALASALSGKDESLMHASITDPDGYVGINGVFKVNQDGTNTHSLDIVKVTQNGLEVTDSAPKKITPKLYQAPVYPAMMPEIYGKNADVVYQKLSPKPASPTYFNMF